MQIPCIHEAPFSSLLSRNGSCLPRQDILGLKVDGMDQATASRQIHSTVRPRDGVRACKKTVRCPDERLSSRRRLQSLRPSETFQRLVRHETSICRVLQIPSCPRCHGVTLVRKLRFTALYWPSHGEGLQKRRPKASTDDHPSTQKLIYL